MGISKAQKLAEEFITDESRTEFSMTDLIEHIVNSGSRVKNWSSVRGVIQYFIGEGLIKRVKKLKEERYTKVGN